MVFYIEMELAVSDKKWDPRKAASTIIFRRFLNYRPRSQMPPVNRLNASNGYERIWAVFDYHCPGNIAGRVRSVYYVNTFQGQYIFISIDGNYGM